MIIYKTELANGFKIKAKKIEWFSKTKAEAFYEIHKGKEFYLALIEFMTSGPLVLLALEKSNAVKDFRTLIGDTDPKSAKPGTIRNQFGSNISRNAIHGSDSPENAKKEINVVFP